MKRLLIILMVMMLLPFAGLAAEGAQVRNQNIPLQRAKELRGEQLQGALMLGGTPYVWTFDGLYALKGDALVLAASTAATVQGPRGDEQKTRQTLIHTFASDGDKLYGLDLATAALYEMTIRNQALKSGKALYLQDEEAASREEGMSFQAPNSLAIAGGQLYGIKEDETGEHRMLVAYDLQSGDMTAHEIEHLLAFTPYRDGKLLVATLDELNAWDSETDTKKGATLSVYDPGDRSLSELGTLQNNSFEGNNSSLLYDADSDTVLYTVPYGVMRRLADGTEETCAYLPVEGSWGGPARVATILPDGRFGMVQGQTLYLRSTDPKDYPAHRLVLYSVEGAAHDAVVAALPDVAITSLANKWFATAQEMAQALVSGEDGIDILSLNTSEMDVPNLLRKGYALDLDDYPFVQAYMSRLDPMLRNAGMVGDKVYALPIHVSLSPLGLNERAFQKLGLPLPETFGDLCELITLWHTQHAENTEFNLSNQPDQNWVMSTLLYTYANHCAKTGQELNLDTPLFREMVAQMQLIPAGFFEPVEQNFENAEEVNDFFYRPALLYLDYGVDLQQTTEERIHLREDAPTLARALKATKDGPAAFPVSVKLMLVNSKSPHVEGALRYLEGYLSKMADKDKALLCPEENGAILNPDYPNQMEKNLELLSQMRAALTKMEGADKTQQEENIKQAEILHAQYEKDNKYLVTADVISGYRALMQNAYLPAYQDSLLMQHGDFQELRRRFMEGQLTLDQYISETDSKLRLMRLELQ